jgi:hypothetical protein
MLRIIDKFLYMFKSPHDEGPGNALSSDAGIPDNILAFRTITTILGQLPRTTPIEVTDNLESNILNSYDRQEVRMTDAFAHIAAGEHDIAAITTNRSFGDDTKLHVLACTKNPITPNNPITPLPISIPANLIANMKVWYLMFTRNFRRKDSETSSKKPYPIIISPSKPHDLLEGQDAFTYMVGLEQHW